MTTTIQTSKPREVARDVIAIPDRLFFRIGDVAELLQVKPHVLRYWESEFPIVSPQKGVSGQRIYRRSDVETLVLIRHLLHEERYSIEGARKRIRELRKEGALRSYKKEVEQEKSQAGDSTLMGMIPPNLNPKLQHDLESLKDLAQQPLERLFHL